MNILVTGDFFVSDSFKEANLFSNNIVKLFKTSDYNVINLESPIINNIENEKIIKIGPHLRTNSTTVVPFLKQLEVNLSTLANNHIMDYGRLGLEKTFESLNNNKINHVGAGLNLSEASRCRVIKNDNVSIAILNFAENEWSISKKNKAGANPLNVYENCRHIKEAKQNYDKVICIIHGGHEYYNLPSPNMVNRCKFYVENGADAIICHHSHCISGYEIYKESPIAYGLGNFIFTLDSESDGWYNGLIANLKITKNQKIELRLIPISQQKNSHKLTIIDSEHKKQVEDEVNKYSNIISNPDLLNLEWKKFVNKKRNQYLFSMNPLQFFNNKYLLSLLRKIRIDRLIFNRSIKTKLLHLMRCESHYELTTSVLEDD